MSSAGARIALAAMRGIGSKKSAERLFAFYHANTCAVDPIQVITGCTFGNSNIIVKDEKQHVLELVRQSDGIGVKAELNKGVLSNMRDCMELKRAYESLSNETERKKLKETFDEEFEDMLHILRTYKDDSIVTLTEFKIDIKPFLRY